MYFLRISQRDKRVEVVPLFTIALLIPSDYQPTRETDLADWRFFIVNHYHNWDEDKLNHTENEVFDDKADIKKFMFLTLSYM